MEKMLRNGLKQLKNSADQIRFTNRFEFWKTVLE